jgi:16S rRNA A1518/A1519 N6-dimethyltransferase RsmA/KsgA/DIM1 with predicted DNA glycosylase/AP lyase activity
MLSNNLKSLAKPDQAREALRSLDLPTGARAEELTVAQLAGLHVLLEGS